MALPIWGNLDRAVNDSTKIDQAIADAIGAHNDDPESHLGEDQSLQSHRASEIIDHLAESVVNDKIATIARAYVAIVDPASDVDFDTVQAAVDYAAGKGGGTIYLASGDHYLSGAIDLPMSVNFYAADNESCRVHAAFDDGDYFSVIASSPDEQKYSTFENITFVDDGGGIFQTDGSTFLAIYSYEFINCNFEGGGVYLDVLDLSLRFTRCDIDYGQGPGITTNRRVTLDECTIQNSLAESNSVLIAFNDNDYGNCALWAYKTTITGTFTTVNPLLGGNADFSVNLFQCSISNWDYQLAGLYCFNIENTFISGRANRVFTIRDDGNEGLIAFNTILASGSGYVLPLGETVKYVGNNMTGASEHAADGITLNVDINVRNWQVLANSDTILNMDFYRASQLTPNSTRTVTSGVPRAGELRTLIILTSGSSSYTLTFGSGFKTMGTLVTGTTSNRRFVIQFISDGDYLIEISRTTAIA